MPTTAAFSGKDCLEIFKEYVLDRDRLDEQIVDLFILSIAINEINSEKRLNQYLGIIADHRSHLFVSFCWAIDDIQFADTTSSPVRK